MGVNTFRLCQSGLVGRNGYDMLMKTYQEGLKYQSNQEVVDYRLKVLKHYYQFGIKSCLNAFDHLGRSTIYDWKRLYEKSGKKRCSLIPLSTKPKHYRYSQIDYRLKEAILALRNKEIATSVYAQYLHIPSHLQELIPYDLGEKKIKIYLDRIAQELDIPSVSAATIGRIIKAKKLYHPKKCKNSRVAKKRLDIERLKKSPSVSRPGYLQADCIIHNIAGKQIKCVNFIDVFGKIAYSQRVVSINSHKTLIAFREFSQICNQSYHFDVFALQHDNGAEFFGELLAYLEETLHTNHDKGIANYFILPRCPKINGTIENFNHVLQTEFINQTDTVYADDWLKQFPKALLNFIEYYNCYRPHGALNYMSPKNYLEKYYSEM